MTDWRNFGLSGYLAPDGHYYECEYMEHGKLAQELVELYQVNVRQIDTNRFGDFIKFGCAPWISSREGDHMCHAFMFAPPTDEQVAWLRENMHRMTVRQEFAIRRALYVHDREGEAE